MLALASLVWTASDCDQRTRLAEIGLTSMISLDEPLVRVAQETLDSLGRGSGLRLVLLPVPAVHGEVMTEVSRAAFFVARPRVVGVIGPTSSQAAMETASIYADGAVPHIVTTGTNRRLAWLGPWTFTLAPDDSIEAAFIAGFVRSRLAPGRLVLVQATDLYGWGIGDATASALERQGRGLVARIPLGGLACGDGQVPALLRVVLRAGPPDVVILAGHTAESECAVRAFGPKTRYIVTDGLGATPWPEAARGLDLWAVTFWDRGSTTGVSRDFRARFERLAGHTPTGEQALIYDGILAMGHAVLAAGPDRKRVRDYLATLGAERPEIQGATGGIALRGVRRDRLVLEHWVDGRADREAPW